MVLKTITSSCSRFSWRRIRVLCLQGRIHRLFRFVRVCWWFLPKASNCWIAQPRVDQWLCPWVWHPIFFVRTWIFGFRQLFFLHPEGSQPLCTFLTFFPPRSTLYLFEYQVLKGTASTVTIDPLVKVLVLTNSLLEAWYTVSTILAFLVTPSLPQAKLPKEGIKIS